MNYDYVDFPEFETDDIPKSKFELEHERRCTEIMDRFNKNYNKD